jgi:hypothetical protein
MESFSQEIGVMFYNDFCSVMEVLIHEIMPNQWRLFIDLSNVSLKMALLHNGNKFSSGPLAHAANMKECCESMKLLLGKLSMTNLSGSYVVISRLWHCYLECNSGTRNIAISCESGTRDKKNRYVNKQWLKRTFLVRFLEIFSVRVSSIHCDSAWIASMFSNQRPFNFILGG